MVSFSFPTPHGSLSGTATAQGQHAVVTFASPPDYVGTGQAKLDSADPIKSGTDSNGCYYELKPKVEGATWADVNSEADIKVSFICPT